MTFRAGNTISHYKLLECVGSGGMGVVYKAEDLNLGRPVAVKFLNQSVSQAFEEKQLLMHEARATAVLQHPNICSVHDIDESDDGNLFIVMEYCNGESLKSRIARGPLDQIQALEIARQLVDALVRAHEAGIVHRDLKPANVIMTPGGTAKIIDFGLAKFAGQSVASMTGIVRGTIGYMSPEQALGMHVDHQTDLWSLGVILYEMLAGRKPFGGDNDIAAVYRIVNEPYPRLKTLRPDVPSSIERIVDAALVKDPAGRYRTAKEMWHDITAAIAQIAGGKSSRLRIGIPRLLRGRSRKYVRPLLIAGLPIVLLVGISLGILSFRSGQSAVPSLTVVSFRNLTGIDSLDYLSRAIPVLLTMKLEQSPKLRVTPQERVRSLMRQINRGDTAFIDSVTGLEVCVLEGSQHMITGGFARTGDLFVLEAVLLDVKTQRTLQQWKIEGRGVEALLRTQIDELGERVAEGEKITLGADDPSRRPIAVIATSSPEALRRYLLGRDAILTSAGNAIPPLREAVRLDATFAIAHFWLAQAFGRSGWQDSSKRALITARSLAWKSPEKERLLIEAEYARSIEGDLPKATTILEDVLTCYPAEIETHRWLDRYLFQLGKPDARIPVLKKLLALDPGDAQSVLCLSYVYAEQNQTDSARTYSRRLVQLQPTYPGSYDVACDLFLWAGLPDSALMSFHVARNLDSAWPGEIKMAYLLALKGNGPEARMTLDRHLQGARKPRDVSTGMLWQAFFDGATGRIKNMGRNLTAAKQAARSSNALFDICSTEWLRAWTALERGDTRVGKKSIDSCFLLQEQLFRGYVRTTDPAYWFASAMLAVREGQMDSLKRCIAQFEQVRPTLTLKFPREYQKYWSTILATWKDNAAESQDSLVLSLNRYHPGLLPNPGDMTPVLRYNIPLGISPWMLPPNVAERGDALTDLYRDLSKVTPGAPNLRLPVPKHHFYRARLLWEKGLKAEASDEYRTFLELWRDADPRLPEAAEATGRIARAVSEAQKRKIHD